LVNVGGLSQRYFNTISHKEQTFGNSQSIDICGRLLFTLPAFLIV